MKTSKKGQLRIYKDFFIICKNCGKKKRVPYCHRNSKFCSSLCGNRYLAKTQRGSKHPMWNKGIKKDKYGYSYRHVKYHPNMNSQNYVFEHRIIMEDYLGRFLKENEIIHHKNGIKYDNKIENLQLTNKYEHMKLHKEMRSNEK